MCLFSGDVIFLREYREIMQPICQSLNILQSETIAFLGCLLSAISMAMKKLKELKSSNKIAVGLPLIDSLIQVIESRFGQ